MIKNLINKTYLKKIIQINKAQKLWVIEMIFLKRIKIQKNYYRLANYLPRLCYKIKKIIMFNSCLQIIKNMKIFIRNKILEINKFNLVEKVRIDKIQALLKIEKQNKFKMKK